MEVKRFNIGSRWAEMEDSMSVSPITSVDSRDKHYRLEMGDMTVDLTGEQAAALSEKLASLR